MTGLGKYEDHFSWGDLQVEVKSVNHRFKDYRFRLPSIFSSLEIDLRKQLESVFKRGSFEVSVSFKKRSADESKASELDEKKVSNYLASLKEITERSHVQLVVSPTEFLRNDFYKDDDDIKDLMHESLVENFSKALSALQEARREEGKKIVTVLIEHLQDYKNHYALVKNHKDSFQQVTKEKLEKKFLQELEGKYDEGRFHQEVIYYLEKLDIQEEVSRIQMHLDKVDKLLLHAGPEKGRQLEFILQELNRETNTIGSKSAMNEISQAVIGMKVQLEKIREQALNLQ